ncbi:adenylate/guanylate cyclase domain-containing protein [Dongia sp.]|uniref:adenylate/guanylate cyclase domain-containing protein n=1 Tax=Dongia sp. TaxID=1977262 RepID=UPI0035B27FF6
MLEHSLICKGCWQQMHMPIPLRGLLSLPFRMFGIKPSRMNPNTCTVCELMFTKVMRSRKITIDATVLFADLRGCTALSQLHSAEAISALLDAFYDSAADAIWEQDGLLNKTIGDAVMAVFNFPIRQGDHAGAAMRAARAIQERWAVRSRVLADELGLDDLKDGTGIGAGIGIGIHCGEVSFGEFGRAHKDLTAIGNVVNSAARAQGAARPGEILVTQAMVDRLAPPPGTFRAETYQLKGFAEPTTLYAPLDMTLH